jgi:hypothetical protein
LNIRKLYVCLNKIFNYYITWWLNIAMSSSPLCPQFELFMPSFWPTALCTCASFHIWSTDTQQFYNHLQCVGTEICTFFFVGGSDPTAIYGLKIMWRKGKFCYGKAFAECETWNSKCWKYTKIHTFQFDSTPHELVTGHFQLGMRVINTPYIRCEGLFTSQQ